VTFLLPASGAPLLTFLAQGLIILYMEMTLEQLKEKILVIKKTLGWCRVGKYRNNNLYLSEITSDSVAHWGYVGEAPNRKWQQIETAWTDLTTDELDMIEKFVKLKYPKEYEVKRNSYLIDFKNTDTNEVLAVNLKDKKFTKTYANGRQRDIKYPHTFFKGMDGRVIASKIPSDDNFKKLVDTIIQKESACSNMGTFLVRLFDNIHLETYISAGVEFDYNIKVGYDFFDKDVRAILNKHNLKYNQTVERFFANNHDLGKSMLSHIKDEANFKDVFYAIAQNMRDINILVENYKYDVKALFAYCKERDWKSGRRYYGSRDLVSFMCDYARMAELVFPNGFDKYPKDIVDHHDGVTKLYEKEKIKFDDEKYKKLIDEKWEYCPKGKKDKDGNETEKKDSFCVIFPKSTGDIQTEGRILSHCVGSYVQYVLDGKSIILFMRKQDDKATPLVTVEVREGRITQARGKYNRALSYDEKVFLEEYAEKKKLTYNQRY
jgi:hypothetical protein